MARLSESAIMNLGWITNRNAELQEEMKELTRISQMIQVVESEKPQDQFGRSFSKEAINDLKREIIGRMEKAKKRAEINKNIKQR